MEAPLDLAPQRADRGGRDRSSGPAAVTGANGVDVRVGGKTKSFENAYEMPFHQTPRRTH